MQKWQLVAPEGRPFDEGAWKQVLSFLWSDKMVYDIELLNSVVSSGSISDESDENNFLYSCDACSGSCNGDCKGLCEGICEGDCSAGCEGDCAEGCVGACADTCEGACVGSCEENCYAICYDGCEGCCDQGCHGGLGI